MAEQKLPEYWDDRGYHLDGILWIVNPDGSTIGIADNTGVTPKHELIKVKTRLEECPAYDRCSAPICPLFPESLKVGIWYPDEPICNTRNKPDWVKIQRRIAKRAKNKNRYFVFKDFQVTRVQNPKGHDPDRIPPEKSQNAVFTSKKKNNKVSATQTINPQLSFI